MCYQTSKQPTDGPTRWSEDTTSKFGRQTSDASPPPRLISSASSPPLPLVTSRHNCPPPSSLVTINSIPSISAIKVKQSSDYRCVLVRTCTATCADNCIFTRSFVLILLNLLFRLSHSNVLYLTIDILHEIEVFSWFQLVCGRRTDL